MVTINTNLVHRGPGIFQKNNIKSLKDKVNSKHSIHVASGTATLRHNPKKSRHAPLPPSQHNPSSRNNSDLVIRAPSELLFGVPSTLVTQWRHQPAALVTGNVKYLASVSISNLNVRTHEYNNLGKRLETELLFLPNCFLFVALYCLRTLSSRWNIYYTFIYILYTFYNIT